ncbi:MAG: hypothetical protein A2161_05485 [Candidatus Schekmanbacteria bacterium RBG_13_48_7]|uniref:Uncharacterized protein n=1 Tax=Candidatus Schekmanbacteria bacterium RBG_13_48_7 TaxID=1817878 RepID=A0A1F7S617_9BACT|nr:MAG: hypothetical protein A2161_05485 [Candidatus Schekmanbacteria bacterium RBG_13_48_7]
MNALLSDRLGFNIREKRGLAYAIGSSFHIASGGENPWGSLKIEMGTRHNRCHEKTRSCGHP